MVARMFCESHKPITHLTGNNTSDFAYEGMTGTMHCKTTGAGAACGGIPSQNIPDCAQPTDGQAPSEDLQSCLNRITDFAIELAQKVCNINS